MRVFCAGFNLYGQYLNIDETCIKSFKETIYNNVIDLQISHTYLITQVENHCLCNNTNNKIYLHGFLRNKIRQKKELDFGLNDITQISVSDTRSLFLSREQNIFSLSFNVNADSDVCLVPEIAVTDQNEKENETNLIIKIASGTHMNNAYSNLGYIYNIPSRLECKISNLKDICTGREHCLLLTQDGLVYSFGGGSRGQLGHGDVEDSDVPELVKSVAGVKIVKIACGAWHSVALSVDGDLYTWGLNINGQLGLATNVNQASIMASPQVVEMEVNITDVACGSRHTVILSECSKLYGCGWNKYSQLGIDTTQENQFEFTLLHDFSKFSVIGVRCGAWNTAVLVSD